MAMPNNLTQVGGSEQVSHVHDPEGAAGVEGPMQSIKPLCTRVGRGASGIKEAVEEECTVCSDKAEGRLGKSYT